MKRIIIILTTIFFLASCLKDERYKDGQIGHQVSDQNIVELALPNSTKGTRVVSLQIVDKDTVLSLLPVRISSGKGVQSAMKIELDTSVTAKYVAEHPGVLGIGDCGGSIVTPLSLTIPAGSIASESIAVKINTADFDPSHQYVVGFKIKSLSNSDYLINQNYDTYYLVLGAKNKYDGSYTLTVKTVGWAAYGIADGIAGNYPEEIELITRDGSSVSTFGTKLETDLLQAFTGGLNTLGNATVFGATTPLFVFDNNTNKLIEVRNTTPPDTRQRTLMLNPAVTDSRFDPLTKTIYASFIMKQTGRPNQMVYDTLYYKGVRE